MIWSQFSSKTIATNFSNSTAEINDWDKITVNIQKKMYLWNRVRPSMRGKLIVNQILSPNIGQIYTTAKYIREEIQRRLYNFLYNEKQIKAPRHLAQLLVWRVGLGILNMDTELSSLKIK